MAHRLILGGEDVVVYNRTKEKVKGLVRDGAKAADSVGEAVQLSDCIILMLSDERAIEEALFSDEKLDFSRKTVIQMGTISPRESIEFQKKVYQQGGDYFECPVLGSRSEAEAGNLILMVGSSEEKFNNWKKLLCHFGPDPKYIGGVGKAAALKLAMNQLIAAHAVSFSLSLGLVREAGIDVKQFMDILGSSALFAPMFEKKMKNWKDRNFENPNFPTKHLLKDVKLVEKTVREYGLSTDVIASISALYEKALDSGLADQDYSSIYNIIHPQKL